MFTVTSLTATSSKTIHSYSNYDFNTNTGTAIHQSTKTFETTRDVLDVISSTNASTNAVISGSDYSVNAIGQRTAISRSGSATPASASASYGYNNRGELISADEATNAQDRAYQFDGIGNRQKTVSGSLTLPGSNNHSVNALNQYTTIPNLPATPSYDDDGNATAYPLPVNTAANAALTYDGENRLIKVVTGSTTVEYIYDAFNRRVAKTVGSTRTYYVYDGWNCIAEYTGAVHTTGAAPTPTPTYTHTWGTDLSGSMQGAGGVGGLLQTTAHSTLPTHHYPIYDGNGNITAYIDNACSVQASFDYDPFGNITNNNNPQNLPYAFSTKSRETETGLYYYGYRFYDPATGRWINRDPIQEAGGLNLYGFVKNDGVNFIDILGLEQKKPTPVPYPSPNYVYEDDTLIPSLPPGHVINSDCSCAQKITVKKAFFKTDKLPLITNPNRLRTRGVLMVFDFTYEPKNKSECTCESIDVIQSVRKIKFSDQRITPDIDRQTSGRGGHQNKTTGWNMDWAWDYPIDRIPWWTDMPHTIMGTVDFLQDGKPGTYLDTPGSFDAKEGQELITCFVARKKDAPPRIVGCLTWGFYMEKNGNHAMKVKPKAHLFPDTPKYTCEPPSGFFDGVKAWNNSLGETHSERIKKHPGYIPF